jgi:hypothetical protein
MGKAEIANRLKFHGALIERDLSTGAIFMSMRDYVKEEVHVIPLAPARRRQQADAATAEEKKMHRIMAGVVGFLGQGVLPMTTFVSSFFLQGQPRLTVFELDLRNRMIKSLLSLDPVVRFPAVEEEILSTRLLAISDTSFNTMGGELYRQGGYISGLLVRTHARDAFYFVDQYSSCLKRVR